MIRTIVGSSILFLATYAAQAQSQPLAFEAASLKPTASPGTMDRIMRRMSGGPGTSDPGRFTYSNIPLRMLIEMAYNVKEFQVEGPDWLDSEGFDLVATMPPGTTKEQASEMMQTLLKERFKLELHRETKPMPMFALVVGRGGSKMKEADVQPPPPPDTPPAPGRQGIGRGPGVRMMMSPEGIHMAGQMTMDQLAQMLTRQMQRPVVDKTELTKTYDVDITWMPDSMDGARMMRGGGASEGPGGPDGSSHHADASQAMSLAQALDEKLGLKLDARKSPAEVLIVDHAERTPVEN